MTATASSSKLTLVKQERSPTPDLYDDRPRRITSGTYRVFPLPLSCRWHPDNPKCVENRFDFIMGHANALRRKGFRVVGVFVRCVIVRLFELLLRLGSSTALFLERMELR